MGILDRAQRRNQDTTPAVGEPAAARSAVTVRRLGISDRSVLDRLAEENDHFGMAGERAPLDPLPAEAARKFLSDDRTVCLVAFDGFDPVGFLYACELYRRHTDLRHLCLYEIGVDIERRGEGVGAELMAELARHAKRRGITRGFALTHESDAEVLALFRTFGGVSSGKGELVVVLPFS